MPLKLMYITNKPHIASIVTAAGVDRIFIDLESYGKAARQGGMDTVQSKHTVADIKAVRAALADAEILVRCNPVHDAAEGYCATEDEIDAIIAAGADVIMLPYFKTADEVSRFLRAVNGRIRTMLLFETPESVENVQEILALRGIDEVFIGLNDLSLGYGMNFMFRLVADGTVERLCNIFKTNGLPYGFGGIAALGKGMLPAERVIAEHYRMGSTCAILSRSFCNTDIITDVNEIETIFNDGLGAIRAYEAECEKSDFPFEENRAALVCAVDEICKVIKEKA